MTKQCHFQNFQLYKIIYNYCFVVPTNTSQSNDDVEGDLSTLCGALVKDRFGCLYF